MAVTKIWAIHDSVSRVVDYCANPDKTKLSDLEQVLIYATNKAKTLDENEQQYAVSGINCSADTAAEEMAATQRRFGKTGGNVAYHAYQSFKTGEVSAEECHRIGVETARRLWSADHQGNQRLVGNGLAGVIKNGNAVSAESLRHLFPIPASQPLFR